MTQYFKPLHLACADYDSQPNYCLIEVANDIATATNGSIIVKNDLNKTCSLDPEMRAVLNGKFIHMEVWKQIHKCDFLEVDEDGIYCHKKGIKSTFDYSYPNGEFFSINTIIRDIKDTGQEEKGLISYSPNNINIIAKIFQEPEMIFSFSQGGKGTIVYPFHDSGMFAVLMPRVMEPALSSRYLFT